MCRDTVKDGKHCFYLNRTALEDSYWNMEDFEIKYEQCQKKGEYIFEEIHEEEAVKKIQAGGWFDKDDSIVLDVDEDYFGCESAGAPLVHSGASWVLVLTLSSWIDNMICPRVTKHENEAEDFLMPIITETIKICKDTDISCEDYVTKIQEYASLIMKQGLAKNLPFLCSNSAAVMADHMKRFVKHLVVLNKHQLKTVASTGLCMMTTPKSSFFNMKKQPSVGNFHICTGFNSPNDSIVLYHSPDVKEVQERIRTLHALLVDGVYPNMKLTTVCRSVRDGYTPRGHFDVIEKGILDVLGARLGKDNYKIVYDKDLLGGSQGWPSRHKTVLL